MSNLTDLLPSGAGGKQVSFTASGTIAQGKPVILNSDGTVTQVAGDSGSQGIGSETLYTSPGRNIVWQGATFDSSNNKVVFGYRDAVNSGYGTAVVGTVSGTSISFGTPVVYNSAQSDMNAVTFDSSNNKVVVAYQDNGNSSYGTAIVGTVSGTSISFGSEAVFNTAQTENISATFDSYNNKVVIAFGDDGNSSRGTAIVGTVSGTSISFGTPQVFDTSNTDPISATFDSNSNKVVIAFNGAGGSATAVVGTVSGTSISFGSLVDFDTSYPASTYVSATFDSNSNKVVLFYRSGDGGKGTAVVGTVSGTSISFGTPVTVDSAATAWQSATFDSNANKVVLCYRDDGNSNHGTLVVGTVSGTSISFGSEVVFNAGSTAYIASTFDSNLNKVVIGYRDQDNSYYGTGVVFQLAFENTNLTSTNFLGIADAAISDSASGKVTLKGGIASSGLSGLTPNATYYVQNDGSLASGSIPFSISGATFTQNFSVSAQDSSPRGIAFNTDGTKMFITGNAGSDINEYALTTGFDISTASYSQNFSVNSQTTSPRGVVFNTNGTKMFVVGQVGSAVYEYDLTTGFDISTASYSQNFSLASQETGAQDVAFNSNGTKMFIVGHNNGQNVNEYTLSTGFDVSTASYSQNFSVSSQDTIPTGITFNTDGTSMFITGQVNDKVFEYTLTSGFDVSTASYSSTSFSVLSEESNPLGLVFNSNGTKMFITGTSGDEVNEYATTPASTTVTAGKALSTTSINLEYNS